MERLTTKYYKKNAIYLLSGDIEVIGNAFDGLRVEGDAIDLLSDYEDTNLTPAEIEAMKSENSRLISEKIDMERAMKYIATTRDLCKICANDCKSSYVHCAKFELRKIVEA